MTDWYDLANCLGMNPDTFFPARGDMQAFREARAICARCTVRNECLEANLHEQDGVWGGTSPLERQRIRGARMRARREA